MIKNAIITGASGGIGNAILRKFAENGINCWACSSRTNSEFEIEVKEISDKYGVWIRPIYFDLLNEEAIKKSIQEIINSKESINILVNNAAVSPRKTLMMTSSKEIREIMEINFISQMIITRMVQKSMIRQRSGSIINIGSVSGCIYADEGGLAYGASKAALIHSTKVLAKELAHYNIRVNAVSPGFINTKMWNERSENMIKEALDRSVMKRMGRPEEVANAVYFLASEEASFITGTNIICQGG